MPGYSVRTQKNGEVREGLKCFFCTLLLKDPVQSSESGRRYCKDCFKEAVAVRSNSASGLAPHEKAWPDYAVKKEISNLQVVCENIENGCEWKGLFKNLLQEHLPSCQYVTVECRNTGCGERVLLSNIEQHLKHKCHSRFVKCKDCDKELLFKDLEAHDSDCPNILKKCKICQQEIPAVKLDDHVMNKCDWIKCPCSSEKDMLFEKTSKEYCEHLQDTTALASHLQPLINQFFKMNQSLQEMTNAYQMVTSKISVLEGKSITLEKKNEALHQENVELQKTVKKLAARVEANEKKVTEVAISKADDFIHANNEKISTLEMNYERLESEVLVAKNLEKKNCVQVEVFNNEIEKIKRDLHSQPRFPIASGELIPYSNSNPADYIKQVEEKTLEVERTLNILSVHHSELELQLQASLASTHNGAFLWRVPEMRRRIRDAKIGRITSIYSPPFYTGRNGYKMCIRAYLNGDGSGEGTHLSIFFVIMKGEYDPLLQWPFDHKVSLVVVDQDQKNHLVQTFKPNLQSNSFQKPKSDMNVASGCPEFAQLSILDDPSYVKDDVMYIKAIVDTSKILHP